MWWIPQHWTGCSAILFKLHYSQESLVQLIIEFPSNLVLFNNSYLRHLKRSMSIFQAERLNDSDIWALFFIGLYFILFLPELHRLMKLDENSYMRTHPSDHQMSYHCYLQQRLIYFLASWYDQIFGVHFDKAKLLSCTWK